MSAVLHYNFSFECTILSGVCFLQTYDSSFPLPSVSVQLMPKDKYTTDISAIQMISSIYFVMAYSFLINYLCVCLVAEKEKKIREGMKMMGLRDSVWW